MNDKPTPYALVRASLGRREAWLDMRAALWPTDTRANLDAEIDRIVRRRGEGCGSMRGDEPEEDAWFVVHGDDPVGFVELSVRARAPGCDGPVPYVEGWFVRPEHRGTGCGRLLMERAALWARERGFDRLASDTTSEFPGSVAAHGASGFETVKTVWHFVRHLD